MDRYFCLKCKKHHHRGKIYKDHLSFKKEHKEESSQTIEDSIPTDKILTYDANKFRPIARRLLKRLLKKKESSTHNGKYIREINKLVLDEKSRLKNY